MERNLLLLLAIAALLSATASILYLGLQSEALLPRGRIAAISERPGIIPIESLTPTPNITSTPTPPPGELPSAPVTATKPTTLTTPKSTTQPASPSPTSLPQVPIIETAAPLACQKDSDCPKPLSPCYCFSDKHGSYCPHFECIAGSCSAQTSCPKNKLALPKPVTSYKIQPFTANCNDTDTGWNLNVSGTATGRLYGTAGAISSYTDFCNNNQTLVEYFCMNASNYVGGNTFGFVNNATVNCTCSSGACIPTPTCYDSDLADTYIAGNTTGILINTNVNATFYDFCFDNQTLYEYYCTSNTGYVDKYPYSCNCTVGHC